MRRLLLLAMLVCCGLGCRAPQPPDLVIVSLDTTRRDHLSVYGYGRPTTPFLEELALRSVVFEEAFTQETNTAPSHASLFTGLYPHEHGLTANGVSLPEGPTTLAEVLSEAGYRTGAFVSGFTMVDSVAKLGRGFSTWDDELTERWRRNGRKTLDRAHEWLDKGTAEQPSFLFLHFYDAHAPYLPSPEALGPFHRQEPGPALTNISRASRLAYEDGRTVTGLYRYEDRYDAQIGAMDGWVRELLERFDLERTVVLIFSDHGETLAERYHQVDHGAQVFDEQLRIPLLLAAPGLDPRRVRGMVESVDVPSTLLRLLDLPTPANWAPPDRTLDPVLAGSSSGRKAVYSAARAVSERHADRGYDLDPARRIYSLRTRDWKLIRYPIAAPGADAFELYDLSADPGEKENVAAAEVERVERMRRELDRWLGGAEALGVDPEDLDPETRKQLEALGYVG